MQAYHQYPVLLNETLTLLEPHSDGVYVDGTIGGGGHAEQILIKSAPDGVLIGIDRDSQALEAAGERLKSFGSRVKLFQGNFSEIRHIVNEAGYDKIDGEILDLGVSSHQLDSPRGFSFMRDEPLDMRMNQNEDTPSAKDIVNSYSKDELANVIYKYGEERYSRQIADAIISRRMKKTIETTGELVEVIKIVVGGRYKGQKIHPATRTFQSLRIETNQELKAIENAIPDAIDILKPLGRLCVISFHSLEDRIVKDTFRKFEGRCQCPPRNLECNCGAKKLIRVLTRKPIIAQDEESRENPRARSSKLRCAQKLMD